MVKESLAELLLPGEYPQTPSERRQGRLHTWLAALIVGVIVWVAITVFEPVHVDLGFAGIAALIWWAYSNLSGPLPPGMKRWKLVSLFGAVAVGVTGLLCYFHSDTVHDLQSFTLPLLLGLLAANSIVEGTIKEPSKKWISTALIAIRGPATDDTRVQGQWPFVATSEQAVWAIMPATRTLRVIRPDGSDKLVQWDDPIRAVELRRVGRVFDAELVIRSGADAAGEWDYLFDISSPYRDSAARWFEIFEGWKIEDQKRAAA